MIVRNKIWDEIVHADANQICARKYANVQHRVAFVYKIAVPLLSGLCAVAIKIDQNDAAFWSAVFLCISTILKAFFPQLILPEKDVMRLDDLQVIFLEYRKKMELLLHRLDNNKIEEDKALSELDKLLKGNVTAKSDLNKLVLWIPCFADKSITEESERYLKATYYNSYE